MSSNILKIAEGEGTSGSKSSSEKMFVIVLVLLLSLILLPRVSFVSAQPSWPSHWIQIDWDKNENGPIDDWRDVEYAYYQYDADYLYLKLECYGLPGSEWADGKGGRYKWFIDLDDNMYYLGGTVYEAEYLIFVEDTDYDGLGEMYLVSDSNNDGVFDEYEPWPPGSYLNYKITDPYIGGWRIVAQNQIEMCIRWSYVGSPTSYKLFWSTDQQNPNLDQSPTTDRVDEEQPIIVHNVAAVSQTATPTTVTQGEQVSIEVVVENKGTQTETFNVTCFYNNTIIDTKRVTDLTIGRQEILTFIWDTAGVPVGTYSIKAWADSSSEIMETSETDNWCTAPATVSILPALIHDVAAVSQVPSRWSAIQGEIITINVTVSNLGNFTETFNVTCYYDETPISYQTVTELSPGASSNLIFQWNTTSVPPNTYYIKAFADSSRVIDEIDESNNNCTTLQAITIYSPGQMGELFVDKVKTAVVSGEDPPIVGRPTTYELTIIVTNTGGSDVTNIVVNETISSDVTFEGIGIPSQGSVTQLPPPQLVWNVGTISPGQNATLTFRITIVPPSLGTFYLNHKEDIIATGTDTLTGGQVSAVGKTDIMVKPIIRDVAAVSQNPSATIASQGDTVTIFVRVKNLGNVSESFDVTCYYDTIQIGTLRLINMAPGGETTLLFEWNTTSVPPGTYSVSAKADSNNEILETDELNNLCTSPATVKIVIHDIAMISQTPSTTKVIQGETVTIQVVVKNEGTEPENFTVSCYYNDTLLEIRTVRNLEPNATITLTFIWDTTGVAPGIYYINAQSSPVPGEKNTNNNACTSTEAVTILAQLSVSISPTTAKIKIGESVTFTSAVSGGEPPYQFQWFLNGTPVSGANSPSWTFTPTSTGFYLVHLNVRDGLSNTAKSNEAGVTVASPLTVSISPTSASILVGQSITFTSTVSGGYAPYAYQWYLNGAPVSGATSPTWSFTPTTAGIYYVRLKVTDANNNVAESNTARITVSSVPVGGYSIPLARHDSTSTRLTVVYTTLLILFGAMISLAKRRRK